MKVLLWVIVVLVALWLLRNKMSRNKAGAAARPKAEAESAEKMIQCAHCGVHLPASEALFSLDGAAFCSEQHRLLRR